MCAATFGCATRGPAGCVRHGHPDLRHACKSSLSGRCGGRAAPGSCECHSRPPAGVWQRNGGRCDSWRACGCRTGARRRSRRAALRTHADDGGAAGCWVHPCDGGRQGKRYCQAGSGPALGYLPASARGSSTQPRPLLTSAVCWARTRVICVATSRFSDSGSMVRRS